MSKDLRTQYDNFANEFSVNHNIGDNSNNKNRSEFYNYLSFLKCGQSVLDMCCGDGYDAQYYLEQGCTVSGIDASEGLINIAKQKYPSVDFRIGLAEALPYTAESFDVVLSKYAIMTSADMKPILNEAHRVLKKGGYFAYLVTHPFRQYFEKRSVQANYFEQKVVTCHILNNSVTLHEPTHTFNEYFNADFFSKFEMVDFKESHDAAAEAVEGRTYPGYFIVVARKK